MTLTSLASSKPQARRWTREEFYKLADEGWFNGQRVMLLEGEIIEMPPQKSEQALAILRCQKQMEAAFGPEHWVRIQMPLDVGRQTDPEPDIAVTVDPPETYASQHPTTALIVIEVAGSSLDLDREKQTFYSSAEVVEYWIVNIGKRELEVYRSQNRDSRRYLDVRVLAEHESIAPLARPDANITVKDLLP